MPSKKSDLTEYAISLVKNLQSEEIKKYSPYYHGTSTYHKRKIDAKGGLCPRGEMPSVWTSESGNLASHSDKVYFAICGETQIPDKSAINAREASQWLKYKDIRNLPEEEANKLLEQKEDVIFFKLNDITPFEKDVVADEDNFYPNFVRDSIYNPDFQIRNDDPIPFCYGETHKNIVDAFDIAYYDKGFEGVKQVLNHIPPVLQSLYSNRTFAIKDKCVPTSQMTTMTEKQFYEENQNCPNYLKSGSQCSEEERKLKDDVANILGRTRRFIYLKRYNEKISGIKDQDILELKTKYEQANQKLLDWIYDHKIKHL